MPKMLIEIDPKEQVVVPRVPTDEMRVVGFRANNKSQGCSDPDEVCGHCGDGFGERDGCGHAAVAAYNAMLAAAPRPEPVNVMCTRCKGECGRTVEEYHGDRIIEVHWVECEHCDGTGEEPAQPIPTAWQPIETAPKSGEFLLGVWEGSWNNPCQRFRVYHASGYSSGPSWAMLGRYRTEEGGAYKLAGWQPLPPAPGGEG